MLAGRNLSHLLPELLEKLDHLLRTLLFLRVQVGEGFSKLEYRLDYIPLPDLLCELLELHIVLIVLLVELHLSLHLFELMIGVVLVGGRVGD